MQEGNYLSKNLELLIQGKDLLPFEFQDNGDPDATKGMCTWEDLGLSMVLTGPVPITNAVTEFSFKLFWDIFPNAVVLVAIGLFIFHSDLLQAGITGTNYQFAMIDQTGPTLRTYSPSRGGNGRRCAWHRNQALLMRLGVSFAFQRRVRWRTEGVAPQRCQRAVGLSRLRMRINFRIQLDNNNGLNCSVAGDC